MAKQITDEEYNQVSAAYDKFMADPNQDPAKVAQVQNLWNQVQEEYKAQKSVTPQNDPMYDEMRSKSDMTDPYYYEHPEALNPQIKTNEQLAREVIQGKRGNGQARKDALANAGYDYNAVQRIVNNSMRKPRPVPPTPEQVPPTPTPQPEPTTTKVTPSWIFKDVWPKVNIPTNNNVNENILRNQPWYDTTTTISPVSHSDKRKKYQSQGMIAGVQNTNGYYPIYNKRGEVIDYLKN